MPLTDMNKHDKKTAYLDCFSGISGDMLLGALLDCGISEKVLRKNLARLNLSGWDMNVAVTQSHGIQATKVIIQTNDKQPQRNISDIENIINSSDLSDRVKKLSISVFQNLAKAEAEVHGCPINEVHFHEVGAVDAIIDIVGTTVLLEYLDIGRFVCSALPMPSGWVQCSHGTLPLPAPATCVLLKSAPVYGVDCGKELVTPTGAALVMTLCNEFVQMPPMVLQTTGYGSGSTVLVNQPNLLRICIGTTEQIEEEQVVIVTECNIDDWSPEGFPYLSEKLFKLGALDVSISPLQMKKGRPGFQLQVISDTAKAFLLQQCILSETTAIGLRYRKEQRLTVPRRRCTVETPWGNIIAKKVETSDGTTIYPEYEECRKVALQNNIPLKKVYLEVSQGNLCED